MLPDVDIDIGSSRRDEVLAWVEERFGAMPAAFAALRAEVEYPIGGLDDLQVVLDHHHRVARLDQAVGFDDLLEREHGVDRSPEPAVSEQAGERGPLLVGQPDPDLEMEVRPVLRDGVTAGAATHDAKPLAALEATLRGIVKRALSRDLGTRYDSARAMHTALDAWLNPNDAAAPEAGSAGTESFIA